MDNSKPTMPCPVKEGANRIEWLDALRGLTMILVVARHVQFFSFGAETSPAMQFLALMRMPAFFFVSGFLAYNIRFEWTVPNALRLTWKKIKVQLIPTIVFFLAFIILRHNDFLDTLIGYLKGVGKGGYWFTYVLLQFFIIYYAVCLATKNRHLPILLLWPLSFLVFTVIYYKFGTYFHTDAYLSTYYTAKYLQFFLFGNIVHRYWNTAQRLFDSRWFFPVVVVMAFLCCTNNLCVHIIGEPYDYPIKTLINYLLVLVLVMFFRHYEAWFTKDTRVGQTLQYVGVRTLDVYLLHYILLPVLPSVGVWLDANQPNFVVEMVLTVGVAAVVIAFCLLISNILRVSPFLRLYLFGRK